MRAATSNLRPVDLRRTHPAGGGRSSTLDANATYLMTQIGGRMSGSPNMRKAVAWAVDGFKRAGVDEVHVERFQIPASWSAGEANLTLLGKEAFPVRVVSITWAPPVTLEARIIERGQGEAMSTSRAPVPPHAARWCWCIPTCCRPPWTSTSGVRASARPAANAGGAPILWMSTREGSTRTAGK